MQRFAGGTMIAGSLLFIIGGISPVVRHVFGTDDGLAGLTYIEQDPAAWDWGIALFGAGGLVAALGLVLLARSVQRVTSGRVLATAAYAAAALATAGALSWVIICYLRITRSPYDVVFLDINPWLFRTYGFFTQTAFIILGAVLLRSSYPNWLAWMLIIPSAIFYVPFVTLGGLPLVYYFMFLVLGVTLLIPRPRPRRQSLEPVYEKTSPG
jgi:hypothetical protein